MLTWELPPTRPQPRLAAVSYLNTVPLVFGMQHGPQRDECRLHFSVPSECARLVEAGEVDLGIVPVAEIERQRLETVSDVGIACRGPVRSILLASKVEPRRIRTLAADAGSRTSVRLAAIILAERFGASPEVFEAAPILEPMLERADAALLIGDAALAVDPAGLPRYSWLDLGEEWQKLTGLPMVFALWAGRPERVSRWERAALDGSLAGSLDFGLARLDEIVEHEARRRSFPPALVREYLSRHIVFHIGARERQGLAAFGELSAMLRSESIPSL